MSLTLRAAEEVLVNTESRRQAVSTQLGGRERSSLGQFFTPSPVAQFIASLPALPNSGTVRILDPGAGIGSLSAAIIARIVTQRSDLAIELTAVEVDASLSTELKRTLDDCQHLADSSGCQLISRVIESDFLEWASDSVGTIPLGKAAESFDIVVMNPPYRKVNTGTRERLALKRINVEASNLYVAFLALSCALLSTDGQIAAITPRSFANGPYFRSFRRYFLDRVVFDRIHLFESRSMVFSGDAVLQENVIFSVSGTLDIARDAEVVISSSVGADEEMTFRKVPHAEVVDPKDPDCLDRKSTRLNSSH